MFIIHQLLIYISSCKKSARRLGPGFRRRIGSRRIDTISPKGISLSMYSKFLFDVRSASTERYACIKCRFCYFSLFGASIQLQLSCSLWLDPNFNPLNARSPQLFPLRSCTVFDYFHFDGPVARSAQLTPFRFRLGHRQIRPSQAYNTRGALGFSYILGNTYRVRLLCGCRRLNIFTIDTQRLNATTGRTAKSIDLHIATPTPSPPPPSRPI